MDKTDQAMVEKLDALILEGDYTKVCSSAERYIYLEAKKPATEISAEVWLRLILALKWMRWETLHYRTLMYGAPDYTQEMEGDFRLKEMTRAISAGNSARAEGLRKQIVRFHRHDPERMIKYWEVVVLLHELRRRPDKAQRTRVMIEAHRRKLKHHATSEEKQ